MNARVTCLRLCVVNAIGTLKKHFCEKELKHGDPIRHFLLWCAEDVVKKTNSYRGERNDYVFVAHNASGYDTQFVYQAAYNMFGSKNVSMLLHMNRMIELKIQIATGSRLSTMIFKDSYKFINLPLRAMPKSFGFHNELQKGFFPHDLNTKDNLDYKCLGLPDRKFFGTNEMTMEMLKRFEAWYVNEDRRLRTNDAYYVLREEMIKYCYDDCNVLSSAFSKFNKSMIIELKNSGVVDIVDHQYTILADFITLPQMVIHWFVGVMLPERTLSIVPHRGYEWGKCGSYKERIWLTWLDKQNANEEGESFVLIQSRYSSGGQMKVGRYYLDGFRQIECGKRVCYEFYGCYYHGCVICFPDRNKVIRKKHREEGHWTVRDASEYTMERELAIRDCMDFRENVDEFIVMWEHEYNAREKEMKEYIGEDDLYHIVDRLNPRDAVKGGRTEAFRMHCSIDDPDEEEIKYLDINSLYPYVMSKVEFPIGHPEIRRGDEACRNYLGSLNVPFIGLCMVKILPPSNLFFPCLAHKMNGKLLFSLCRMCLMSNEIQRRPCRHTEEQRAWIDVYTSITNCGIIQKEGVHCLETSY